MFPEIHTIEDVVNWSLVTDEVCIHGFDSKTQAEKYAINHGLADYKILPVCLFIDDEVFPYKERVINQQTIKELLKYDETTGKFYWKRRTPEWFVYSITTNPKRACRQFNSRCADKEAGLIKGSDDYFRISIFGQKFLTHRLVWLYVTGKWPNDCLDHIDGNPQNNRFENLREVDRSENNRNCAVSKSNKSGTTGVFYHKQAGKWQAYINNGGNIKLGFFDDKEDAIKARKEAEVKYGYHKNHGRPRNEFSSN